MWTQAPELPWFDFSRSKLHNYSYFPQPADTSFQLSGPSFQSPCLHNPVPSSFYQKSCICHFLSHLAFYVTSNQYIKTLLQLLLPYSNFLHFCKSGSVLSPPSCYPVFCATFVPHLLYSFMQVIPFHSFYAAVWWPALHHSKSLSWGCSSKPGPLRAGTAGHFK